jgi:hypothetical protein
LNKLKTETGKGQEELSEIMNDESNKDLDDD